MYSNNYEGENIKPKVDAKEKVYSYKGGKSILKIAAILFVVLFSLLIVFGIARMYHFKSSLISPSESQKNSAIAVATASLEGAGENASNYKVQVSQKVKRVKNADGDKDILQVSFYNDSVSHFYLIDVDSGEVLMRSQTEFFGWMKYPRRDGRDENGKDAERRGFPLAKPYTRR